MPAVQNHVRADPAAQTDAWEKALLDHQLAELGRLAAMGMDIAAALHGQATAPDGAASPAERRHAALDFSRAARAVRLTFALQSRLIADFKAPARAAKAETGESGGLEVHWIGIRDRQERRQQDRIQLAVARAADDAALDRETVERLVLEAGERLDRDQIWDDLKSLPFDEIVARICGDLGIEPPAAGMAQAPFPLDGGVRAFAEGERSNGDGGDLSAVLGLNRHPDSRPLPHQGGKEIIHRSP